jgi:hypothetical protein
MNHVTFELRDDLHDETQGHFGSRNEAIAEAARLAALPWNQPPNLAPCASWESCGRNYEVVEFDTSGESRSVLGVTPVVSIDRDGVRWALDRERSTAKRSA